MYTYSARVVDVIDGDTVRVDVDLGMGVWVRNEPLRLLGIDAPELYGDSKEAGLKSKEFLSFTLLSAESLVIETVKDKKGKYGRYLAKIFITDDTTKTDVNELMVKEGMAERYEID